MLPVILLRGYVLLPFIYGFKGLQFLAHKKLLSVRLLRGVYEPIMAQDLQRG